MESYEVHVLHNGYSKVVPEGMEANCTCTLIKGPKNIIVDTMTPWDRDIILNGSSLSNFQPNKTYI